VVAFHYHGRVRCHRLHRPGLSLHLRF